MGEKLIKEFFNKNSELINTFGIINGNIDEIENILK